MAYGKGIGGQMLHEGIRIAVEQLKAMVAWCMTDGAMVGSNQTDFFIDNIVKEALMPYMS